MDGLILNVAERLRVGDIVTLTHAKPNEGWLSAEGVVNLDCYLARDHTINALENCLWQVTVQNQYSATSEYEEYFIATNSDDAILEAAVSLSAEMADVAPNPITEIEIKLAQLKRTALNEQRLNKKLMAMKIGKPVNFGDVVQLQHVKTKKFLTVSHSNLAKQERENMRVFMKENGDSLSWLEFMPRYKYDREGQQIVNDNECYIRVHERSSEYIHAARKGPKSNADGNKEINCSLETSIWTINIYQQARESKSKNIVAGNLVSLQEPETSTYLTLDQQKPGLTDRANVIMSNSMQLSFAVSDCNVGTNLLWMIEREDMFTGGPIMNRSTRIVLRDLNTGLYMSCRGRDIGAVKNREECSIFNIVSTQQLETGANLMDNMLVQLAYGNDYLGAKKVDTAGAVEMQGDRAAALSLIISSKLQSTLGVELYVGAEATVTLRRFEQLTKKKELYKLTPAAIELEFKAVLACLDHLTTFLKQKEAASLFDSAHCNFASFEQGHMKAQLEAVGGTTVVTRQTMMREQGVLDVILDIIERCCESDEDESVIGPSSPMFLRNLDGSGSFRNKSSFTTSLRGVMRAKSSVTATVATSAADGDIVDMCLRIIYLCVHKNHVNQIHIADRFPLLLSQVKEQENAVVCVQEILRDNLQILQTKVSEREIGIFLDLLEESPMNVTLLKLLRSTCSCPTGVDNTQRLVATALFGDKVSCLKNASGLAISPGKKITWSRSSPMAGFDITGKGKEMAVEARNFSKLVIELRSDYSTVRKVNWSEKKLYLPSDEKDFGEVLGYNLVKEGMPRMMVSWQCDVGEEDFSIKSLFNASEIPLEYLTNLSIQPVARGRMTKIVQTEAVVKGSGVELSTKRNGAPVSNRKSGVRRMSRFQKQASARKLNTRKTVTGKVKSTIERKIQIAEYFIAQMYLAADLCLDRNYVAIGMLEASFPIDSLFSILRSSNIPGKFKAAVCRLIRTLYLDREPQVTAKFPRLVKTSVSLSGGDEDAFADHHSGNPYTFAVLQQIISDYLHNDLDATRCDALSAEMLDLLFSLVEFGFYHTPEHLQDIIVPLVQALESHRTREKEQQQAESRRRSSFKPSVAAAAVANSTSRVSMLLAKTASSASGIFSKKDDDDDADEEETKSSPPAAGPIKQRSGSITRQTSKNLSESIKNMKVIEKKSEADASKSIKKDKNVPVKWEEWCLNKLESVQALMLVLLLVILTTLYSTLQIILNLETSAKLAAMDFGVSMIFICELSCRMYLYAAVHKQLKSFVKQPLNSLDIFVVLLDIILLSLDTQFLGDAASFAKSLKTIRTLRLIRIFRAARLLKKIADGTNVTETWVIPDRYSKTTVHEVRTIAGMLRVLAHVHARIQDRKLTCCIKGFVEWYEAESSGKSVDAKAIFHKYMDQEQGLSETIPKKFDQTLIDVAMYMDSNLVKEALKILLLYKSQDELLFQSMRSLQIIYTPKMEMKYKSISQWLKQLQRLAEAFEMWSDMEEEEELKVALSALQAIESIIDLVRVRTMTKDLDLNPISFVDPEVQQLLMNLDAMSVFMSLQQALLDASLGEPHPQIKKIVISSNDLIAMFVENNEANQAIAFKHIDWFLDRVDNGIHSSKVVRSVLSGNRYLIKQCQRRYLAEFMQKIVTNGRKPEYLDMFVGMTQISDTGDSGVSALHNEIARYVTNVDRSSYVLLWCCGPKSQGYKDRASAMAPFVKLPRPVAEEELPSDLQYHINLLYLLAGCKLGPKLQAVYPLDDVVHAMLDPATITHVRNGLAMLVLEMVSAHVEGMEASECMWQLFESVTALFEESCTDLPLLLQKAENHLKLIHRKEYIASTLRIVNIFFSEFDFEVFHEFTSFESDEHFSIVTKRSESDVRDVINTMFRTIKKFRDRHNGLLSKGSKSVIEDALVCWSDFSDESHMDFAVPVKDRRRSQAGARRASIVAEIQQVFYRKQFSAFVDIISPQSTEASMKTMTLDPMSLDLLERLPSVYDPVQSDVRLEPFFLKITTHLRSQLDRTTSTRLLDKGSVDTSIWIMRTLRHIIEKNINTTVEKISNPYLISDVFDISYFHSVMDDYGVTYLCLDLISVGIDTKLCVEAVKLLVVLLTKHGGNASVQKTVHHYLISTDSTLFFEEIKDLIEQIQVWCQREAELAYDQEAVQSEFLPNELYVLQLIFAMCDGNFLANKNMMIDQDGNSRFVNILDHLAGFIDLLSRLESAMCTQVALRVMNTVLGLMRGPSSSCQEHFVLHTELLTALNRLMRSARPTVNFNAAWECDLEVLKEYVIDVLRASIEGQPEGSVVVERVQTAIEVNVLNVLIVPSEVDEFGINIDLSELSRLQAKYLVFLRSLNDKNAEMPSNALDCMKEDTASVEVLWNQKLYTHYFHIPDVSKNLSESSKRKLTEEVDFLTQEIKLNDFIKKAGDLHREGVHQQTLKSFGMVHLWAWKGFLAKFLLLNVIIMNVLMTIHFTVQVDGDSNNFEHTLDVEMESIRILESADISHSSRSSSPFDIHLPKYIYNIIHGLNGLQIALVMITLSITLIVRVPLVMSSHVDQGKYWLLGVLLALLSPTLLWYVVHTIIAWLAYTQNPLLLSCLLLEFIAVDSATKEIMLAVVNPMRQLLTTMAIILIVIHIFASAIFVFFRNEFLHLTCNSMWKSFKLMLSYGFRSEEGIGRYMTPTIGIRVIIDVSFYFIIVVILRNIFFGIIIDTFGELRGIKMDREMDLNGRCFICGIDQQDFDKRIAYGSGIDFKQHRTVTHNMWNYLYFAMRIWQQPRSQDTSLEMYVRQCIETNDVSWFPIGLIGMHEMNQNVEDKVEGEDEEDRIPTDTHGTGKIIRKRHSLSFSAEEPSGLETLDSRLHLIQEKLSSLQQRTPPPATPKHAIEDSSAVTMKLVEKVVQAEIEPLQSALEEVIDEVHSLYGRLQQFDASSRRKRVVSQPSQRAGDVSGPTLNFFEG